MAPPGAALDILDKGHWQPCFSGEKGVQRGGVTRPRSQSPNGPPRVQAQIWLIGSPYFKSLCPFGFSEVSRQVLVALKARLWRKMRSGTWSNLSSGKMLLTVDGTYVRVLVVGRAGNG